MIWYTATILQWFFHIVTIFQWFSHTFSLFLSDFSHCHFFSDFSTLSPFSHDFYTLPLFFQWLFAMSLFFRDFSTLSLFSMIFIHCHYFSMIFLTHCQYFQWFSTLIVLGLAFQLMECLDKTICYQFNSMVNCTLVTAAINDALERGVVYALTSVMCNICFVLSITLALYFQTMESVEAIRSFRTSWRWFRPERLTWFHASRTNTWRPGDFHLRRLPATAFHERAAGRWPWNRTQRASGAVFRRATSSGSGLQARSSTQKILLVMPPLLTASCARRATSSSCMPESRIS